jgi:hypothetical protein
MRLSFSANRAAPDITIAVHSIPFKERLLKLTVSFLLMHAADAPFQD